MSDEFFTQQPSQSPRERQAASPQQGGAHWDSSQERVGTLGTEVHMPLYFTRVAAAAIDYGFTGALYLFALSTGNNTLAVLTEVVFFGSIIANNIVFQGRTGSSVGKRVFGMRIAYMVGDVRADTAYFAHCSVGRTAVRQFAHILDCIFVWGWIRPWWNRAHATYAESVTRTIVVGDRHMHLWTPDEIEAHKRGRG